MFATLGAHGAFADQYRAGPALLYAAAVLGPGQADRVPNGPK